MKKNVTKNERKKATKIKSDKKGTNPKVDKAGKKKEPVKSDPFEYESSIEELDEYISGK